MPPDLLCLTLPQVRTRLAVVPFAVDIYPEEPLGLTREDSLYCIRQRWCEADGQWKLVFTRFSHGIN